MVAIGRALMSNPKLLLCDEISLGLAPIVIREHLRARCRRSSPEGCSLVIVEQDIAQALAVAVARLLPAGRPRRARRRGRPTSTRDAISAAYFGIVT